MLQGKKNILLFRGKYLRSTLGFCINPEETELNESEEEALWNVPNNYDPYEGSGVGEMGLPMDTTSTSPNSATSFKEVMKKLKIVRDALVSRFPRNLIFRLITTLDYRFKGDETAFTTREEILEAIC